MSHEEHNENITPEEAKFSEIYQRANDFKRIQLLRYAKYWYEQALLFNIQQDEVQSKLNETIVEIRQETSIIIKIAAIAVVIVAGYLLLR